MSLFPDKEEDAYWKGFCEGLATGPLNNPKKKFRIKLMQLWLFSDSVTSAWKGIWQTIGIKRVDLADEEYELQRVMVTEKDQELGTTISLPTRILLKMGKCVKLETIYEPPK